MKSPSQKPPAFPSPQKSSIPVVGYPLCVRTTKKVRTTLNYYQGTFETTYMGPY